MMRYTDQMASPLRASSAFRPSTSSASNSNIKLPLISEGGTKISLTPLWEFVVRTKTLPDGLDLEIVFDSIRERLRSPEKEVRQHSLRVLADIIPLLELSTLETYMNTLLDDLIRNLGHIHPAVRKSTLDCLRIYIKTISDSDPLVENLVRTLDRIQESKMPSNLIAGIIIALPFLLDKTSTVIKEMVIRSLIERMVQVTHQEVVLKSLARIKVMLGEEEFNDRLLFVSSPKSKRDFELLCQVYNFQFTNGNENVKMSEENGNKLVINESEKSEVVNGNELVPYIGNNDGIDDKVQGDLEKRMLGEIVRDKVILETEIQLNSGPAITMQIHEESHQDLGEILEQTSNNDNMGLMKVLAKEITFEEFESRRTPRRVRFGGEIVKMRTPDSDSHPSDEDPTIVITPRTDNEDNRPVIEIRYNQQQPQKSKSSKSQIPVPRPRNVSSEPNSPARKFKVRKLPLSKSSPNLSAHEGSRIPKKIYNFSHTIQINFNRNESTNKKKSNKNELLSPIETHKPIEMFYNLTRSPEPVKKSERNIKTADLPNRTITSKRLIVNKRSSATTYKEVHGTINNIEENLLQNKEISIAADDNGQCLTCSSSGSDTVLFDKNWDECGLIQRNILDRLLQKEDWVSRLKALEDLNKILQNPTIIEALETRAASFFHFLFSIVQHARLQSATEETLKIVFSSMKPAILKNRLNQLVSNLCKMGSPTGVRLSILLLKRISSKDFLDQLFANTNVSAKSSKVREGALQILMTISRIFPSTDVDVPKAVEAIGPLLRDRKRRVRRAALETIAVLGQLGKTARVLDIVTKNSNEYPDRNVLIKAVRSRLSRKQLPAVDMDGSVRYSTPGEESEMEWISLGTSSASPSKTQNSANTEGFQNYQPEKSFQKIDDSQITLSDDREDKVKDKDDFHSKSSTVECETFSRKKWKRNYWRNSKFDETESDWSRDSKDKEESKTHNMQIWAVDPWSLSNPINFSPPNGSPVYLLQENPSKSNDTDDSSIPNIIIAPNRRSARGRSFSPPKRRYKEEEPHRFINVNEPKSNNETTPFPDVHFRKIPAGNLHKSSSSDQIRFHSSNNNNSTKSYSSPSDSSSETSKRSGNWQKTFRSGIPVPVSSDSRIRFRTRQIEPSRGPMSIPSHLYRDKSPTPQVTPIINTVSQPSAGTFQPFSSESESQEYYPPPEPHTPTVTSAKSEGFSKPSPNLHKPNLTIVDDVDFANNNNVSFRRVETVGSLSENSERSENSAKSKNEILEVDKLLDKQSESSFSDKDRGLSRENSFEKIDHFRELSERRFTSGERLQRKDSSFSFDDLDKDTPRYFGENRIFSKSEAHLPTSTKILPSLERELSRKSINSAPILNDISYQLQIQPSSTIEPEKRQSLPGSIQDEDSPPLRPSTPIDVKVSPQKTPRKSVPKFVRKSSVRFSRKDLVTFPDTLRPFAKPREGLHETLAQLESPDWEATMRGLQGVVRLTRHHRETVENHMHPICVGLGKQIRNLRSQVARAACLAASEMFTNHRKALEPELEELAGPLLHRTADTNKFLRSDANAALDKMCENLHPSKVVTTVATKGSCHQNAIVRCTAARLLNLLISRLGCERIFQLPKETRDKILVCGANMLMEGNLDTRKHAKMMFGNLSTHANFGRAMMEAVPMCTMRHIQKTLRSLQ